MPNKDKLISKSPDATSKVTLQLKQLDKVIINKKKDNLFDNKKEVKLAEDSIFLSLQHKIEKEISK